MGYFEEEAKQVTSALLEFENVYYSYPGVRQPALKGLTLSIPAGKKSVLIGQNGSGKSTLLFLADGLYKPQQGVIQWRSQPLNYDSHSLNQWRQRIGLAFQDPEQQLVAGTVAEDISYGLCNLQLPKSEIEHRVKQTLADFKLEELASRPLHHLSLGQKRRVALAGVMALKPELLLLDEPTAYLDSLQTRNLLLELERIVAAGTTVVIATHDLDFAYQWADWVFILHQGQRVIEGGTQEVFMQREVLQELEIGVPLLWEVWETLSLRMHVPKNLPFPRTIAQLRERLLG
jgi:cobalt/nickel transport system ATP-binding protein